MGGKLIENDPYDSLDGEGGIEIPEMEEPAGAEESAVIEDPFESAVTMAFIGVGQGGGRMAEAFASLGYARVCALNTTPQDLAPLKLEHRLVIGRNTGGAGKDPEVGQKAAEQSYEDTIDLMMRAWGPWVEQAFVCVGAGGGSGSGSWPVVLRAAQEYCDATNAEQGPRTKLGVIMSLPKRSEGARVQENAGTAVNEALQALERGELATLVLVDNARIHKLFPRLPVTKFWSVANKNVAAVLHTFNMLGAQNSEFHTFDRADFRSVLQSGLIVFGMCKVGQWDTQDAISKAVRGNLKDTLLCDGFDLSKGTVAGAIVTAHRAVLDEVPMEDIDYMFHSLGRMLGNESITLHNGVYESRGGSPLRVFTMVGGLLPPVERLSQLG